MSNLHISEHWYENNTMRKYNRIQIFMFDTNKQRQLVAVIGDTAIERTYPNMTNYDDMIDDFKIMIDQRINKDKFISRLIESEL